MFLYVEDWSNHKSLLTLKGVPPEMIGERFIKVYAGTSDPRDRFPNRDVATAEYESGLFPYDEEFRYGNRFTFSGEELNGYILDKGLPPDQTAQFFALARLVHHPIFRYAQRAMEVKHEGKYLKDHPLDVIDLHSGKPGSAPIPHLDIFTDGSLMRLQRILPYTREGAMLKRMEGGHFRGEVSGSRKEVQ